MQHSLSIVLCGATGLVGRECLELLSTDPAFGRIVVLTRRPLSAGAPGKWGSAKLEEHIVDFDRLDAHAELFRVDQIISALGTTIKQAGSKEVFRQVDLGLPLAIARMGVERGVRHFLLVSAVGANAHSRFFYNRVKGELEDAVSTLPYRSITILRPSLLLGKRTEVRWGEEVAKRLSFLAPAPYRPVSAHTVAAALVRLARENRPGQRIIESSRIRAAAIGDLENV